MLERGQNSVHGRCPTCNQLVTLPVQTRTRRVECPTCQHQATGAAFIDLEAPRPVIVVSEVEERRPDEALTINLDGQTLAVARQAALDEGRTHLILDPADLKDEPGRPSGMLPGQPVDHRVSAAKSAADEARTHFRVQGVRAATADEARTHLLLDPLDLKDEQAQLLERMTTRLRWIPQQTFRLGVWVDELMHGRWYTALKVLAVGSGIASLFDYLRDADVSLLGLVASMVVLIGLLAFGLAGLSRLGNAEGDWDWTTVGKRLRSTTRLLTEDAREFEHSPAYLKLSLVGQIVLVLGLSGLTWSSGKSLFQLGGDAPSALKCLSGLTLFAGVCLVQRALRAAPVSAPAPEELAESLSAASKLPSLIDLTEPLPPSFIGGYTLVHRILGVLSQWRATPWPDQAGYQAALTRHLQRHLPASKIERAKWLGRSRRDGLADIVIDDMVLLQVKPGFAQPAAARAMERVRHHARIWQEKPLILAIFDAPREAVFESLATPTLIELHEQFPLLTARMPTRRP